MKLIIIYGSSAVGKLTIAKQLAAQTGYRLFDNHVSFDFASALFERGTPEFNDLIWAARDLAFDRAAQSDLPGLIFTWAYSHPDFQPYLDRVTETIERHGGEIHLVYVSCTLAELQKRVVQEDRRQAGKLHTIEGLARERTAKNHQAIPDSDSLEIDNTDLSPHEVADRISAHFGLTRAN